MANSNLNGNPEKYMGFMAQVAKRKDNFIQLFLMSGVLLMSLRSLGQKYRLRNLEDDASSLKAEHLSLTSRMDSVKSRLLEEASLEGTGFFAVKLHRLFNDKDQAASG